MTALCRVFLIWFYYLIEVSGVNCKLVKDFTCFGTSPLAYKSQLVSVFWGVFCGSSENGVMFMFVSVLFMLKGAFCYNSLHRSVFQPQKVWVLQSHQYFFLSIHLSPWLFTTILSTHVERCSTNYLPLCFETFKVLTMFKLEPVLVVDSTTEMIAMLRAFLATFGRLLLARLLLRAVIRLVWIEFLSLEELTFQTET